MSPTFRAAVFPLPENRAVACLQQCSRLILDSISGRSAGDPSFPLWWTPGISCAGFPAALRLTAHSL